MQDPPVPGASSRVGALNAITRKVLAAGSLAEALGCAARGVVEEGGRTGACIWLLEEGPILAVQACHGRLPLDRQTRLRPGEAAAGRAALGMTPGEDAVGRTGGSGTEGPRAERCLPLRCGETIVGVLEVHDDRIGGIPDDDIPMLESIAMQVALVIEKSRRVTEVERTRDYLENLIANAGDGILAIDRHRRIVRWNRGCERILGYSAGEMDGATYESIRAPGSGTGDIIGRGLDGTTLESVEDMLRCRDGRWIHVALTLSPIRADAGHVEGISLIVRDVTDRWNMEESFRAMARQIKEFEDKFLGMIERADDAILIVDPGSGTIVQANARAESLIRDNRAALIGRRLSDLHPEGERDSVEARLADLTATGKTEPINLHLLRRKEDPLDVHVSPRPLNYGGRNLVQWICRDISDRRRMEGEKERLQEQLIRSEKLSALSHLINSLAHELNNPLTGVIGYAELLATQVEDPRMARGLDHVRSEARRCHRIVQNLLTFARRHAPERAPVSINACLEKTLDLRSYPMRVDSIRIQRDLQPDLPPVQGNSDQLQQVFLNILVNAHQALAGAGHGGSIRVSTAAIAGKVRVEIADDGPGIKGMDLARIFDPFFTTRSPGQGLGLGLSICQGIVNDHDGTIRALSTPGQGTTIVVDLPHVAAAEVLAESGPVS